MSQIGARITANNVSFQYGRAVVALRDLSFDWPPGVVGLLGRNGAGKTTLMRILVGSLKPATGDVRVSDASSERAVPLTLGFVPQHAGWPGHFRVVEFLQYAAWWQGVARGGRVAAVERVLNDFDLTSLSGRALRSLSGGTLRRVMIAQATIHSPDIIVLDEPTSGLDIQQRIEMRQVISRLAAEGNSTVVLSSHLADDVDRLAAWITILHHGRAVFDGSRADLGLGADLGGLEDRFLELTRDECSG